MIARLFAAALSSQVRQDRLDRSGIEVRQTADNFSGEEFVEACDRLVNLFWRHVATLKVFLKGSQMVADGLLARGRNLE